MILPIRPDPDKNDKIVSRFLAKTALEALAYRLCDCYGWNEELVDKVELDPLREYARYGKGDFWKYHQRRIYGEDDRFVNPINHPEPYEILHEMDFLYLDEKILYFTIVIMGIEYVINLGGSETELYENWLTKNKDSSPIKRGFEYKINKDK